MYEYLVRLHSGAEVWRYEWELLKADIQAIVWRQPLSAAGCD